KAHEIFRKPSYSFGHILEKREEFLRSIGRGRMERVSQSKLGEMVNSTGSSCQSAVSAIPGLGMDEYGPKVQATAARRAFTIRQLMACCMHFGHAKYKWNPKLAPFIFGERDGIHIIDLERTIVCLRQACNVVADLASKGANIVFVGTSENIRRLT